MYPQAPLRGIRPIRGISVAAVGMLAAYGVFLLVEATVRIGRLSLAADLIADPTSVDMSRVFASDDLDALMTMVDFGLFLLTAAFFWAWLFRARANAEAALPVPHRRSKPWLILGWGFPILAFWYPKQIMDDIWTTSKTAGAGGRHLNGLTLGNVPRPGVVWAWWISWLLGIWGGQIVERTLGRTEDLEGMRDYLLAQQFLLVPTIAAAFLATYIILKITEFQEDAAHLLAVPAPVPAVMR